ncbi:MAG: MBL fold metallo-hydrolase, partial [Chloroflexi bacterium]|nr:MBL fold metallo-hydrolase [Chloroflexota bacterium]
TYMLLQGRRDNILIDCAGCPMQALQQVGVDLSTLNHLIVTHRHPDHIYGVPVLVLGLWLCGRTEPLVVMGERQSLATISALLEIFRSEEWPSLFSLMYHEVAMQPDELVLETEDFLITSTPVQHMVPTLALRIVSKATGKVLVYSADTEPCDELVRFAQGADLLLHEATGEGIGHSGSAQAGEIARRCGAKSLALVHLPTFDLDLDDWRRQAERTFGGPVSLAADFGAYEL